MEFSSKKKQNKVINLKEIHDLKNKKSAKHYNENIYEKDNKHFHFLEINHECSKLAYLVFLDQTLKLLKNKKYSEHTFLKKGNKTLQMLKTHQSFLNYETINPFLNNVCINHTKRINNMMESILSIIQFSSRQNEDLLIPYVEDEKEKYSRLLDESFGFRDSHNIWKFMKDFNKDLLEIK